MMNGFAEPIITRNAWQGLAYSPLGAIELPLLVNTYDKHLLTDRVSAQQPRPLAVVTELSAPSHVERTLRRREL